MSPPDTSLAVALMKQLTLCEPISLDDIKNCLEAHCFTALELHDAALTIFEYEDWLEEMDFEEISVIKNAKAQHLKLYLEHGLDPNFTHHWNDLTFLHLAVMDDNTFAIDLLLHYNANPLACAKDGNSAALFALGESYVSYKNPKREQGVPFLADFILHWMDQGGDPFYENHEGVSLISKARRKHPAFYESIMTALSHREALELQACTPSARSLPYRTKPL